MNLPLAVVIASLTTWCQLVAAAPEVPPLAAPEERGSIIETMVRDLGDESYRIREKATRELWALGETALPALKEAAESGTPERAYRARDLMHKIRLHITPDTDPSITAMVDRYLKASPAEKSSLFRKLKGKRAWRQMLKLYASETGNELREKLTPAMNGIAIRAAREQLLRGDADGAREFLEMAPADAEGMLALAEFHRSHGTLQKELDRAKSLPGRQGAAWRLALERAAGNLPAARAEAEAAGEPDIAAVMAGLAGDPLPWLTLKRENAGEDEEGMLSAYASLAAKRWTGEGIRPADLAPFTRALTARSERLKSIALNALFLLGETDVAVPAFTKADPLGAFQYGEALERTAEAVMALGLDPDAPDYRTWVAKRFETLAQDDIEDQREPSMADQELIVLADFLERRGLHQEAFEAFSTPLAELAAKDENEFADFLRALFGRGETQSGAPLLAVRIGFGWAGEDDLRWDDLLVAAFGDNEMADTWWEWLQELKPGTDREERFKGMLALYGIGPDPSKRRQQWLDLAWKAAADAPAEMRAIHVSRIAELVDQTGDVANSSKAWELMPEDVRKTVFWGQRVVHLSVLERWDEAAAVIREQIDAFIEARQEPGVELYAYAAAALRRAGREEEAAAYDAWADKLALGNPGISMTIGNGYAYGSDYKRAGEWWARAARECSPDSVSFPGAIRLHADELLEQGRWKETAAVSEMIAWIYATSDLRTTSPLPFARQRLQADAARALANLGTSRADSIALLEQCHHAFATDGILADFFFPALRKAGLMAEHDRWFGKTWDLMTRMIRQYPESENTRNTAAWLASRALLNLDEAEELLASALRANPGQSAYLDTMAEIQFAKGNRKKALEWSALAVNFAANDLQFPQLRRQQERFRDDPLPRR